MLISSELRAGGVCCPSLINICGRPGPSCKVLPSIVFEFSNSARARPAPIDCRTRLLLDPYLCVGPGSEVHADTLFQVAQRCARLGIALCVERQAWQDAARDPDVRRRNVDLSRFEPLVRLDPLEVPT